VELGRYVQDTHEAFLAQALGHSVLTQFLLVELFVALGLCGSCSLLEEYMVEFLTNLLG